MVTASFLATIYRLSLGDYDATTGIPALHYTPTVGKVVLGAKGSSVSFGSMLFYPRTDGLAITNQNYNQGDIIVDPCTTAPETVYWKVMARRPISVGNVFIAWQMDLAQQPHLTFSPATSELGGFDPDWFDETYFAHFYVTVY